MALDRCPCGRSPFGCQGWHNYSEDEWEAFKATWPTPPELTDDEMYPEEANTSSNQELYYVPVRHINHYTDDLFKFITSKPLDFTFQAGEFVMLGLEGTVKRAYSIASAPSDNFLEFYSIKVPNGELTSKLQNIEIGDTIEIKGKTTGTLILNNVKFGGTLWLLATGTGIAPFMSIIRYRKLYDLFNKIHVVWSVRQQQEVSSYIDFLPTYDIDLKITVTQDDKWNGQYNERITTLIENKIVLPNLDPTQDRVMICGNTEFNEDIKQILDTNGFVEGNATTPGDYVVEKAFVG